jgi:class 3 adenylate cyclase
MADPSSRRKLAAILSADVVGYSRLMAANEAATVETLKAYRDIIARLVVRRGGRVVNAPGDALLAEFPSASRRSRPRSRSSNPSKGTTSNSKRTGACSSASGSIWAM